MIVENYEIAHRNVVSKYYNVAPEEIDDAIMDFHKILKDNGFHPIGLMFYAIIFEPTDDMMTIEVFIPIEEDRFDIRTNEQMYFRSYFNVKSMIMTRMLGEFETESPKKYRELVTYIRRNGLEQRTPLFVEYKFNYQNKLYVEMSIGIQNHSYVEK